MEKVLVWLSDNIPVVTGAVFAFCISLLTLREGSFGERLTKATLCSIFSTGLFYGIVSIFPTCPPEAAVAIGSFVGFYGVDQTKALILDKLTALTGKKNQPESNQHDDVI
jgi:lambda family phage holin